MSENSQLSLQELHNKARSCMEQQDLNGALEAIAQILQILPASEKQVRAKTLANQGFLLAAAQRFEDAGESFKSALEVFSAEGDLVGAAIQTGNIGSLFRDQGKFTEALLHYQKALELLENQDADGVIADQYSNMAYACSQMQDIEGALSYFGKAADIYDKLGVADRADQCRANIEILRQQL